MQKDQHYPANVNVQTENATINAKEFLWKYVHYGWLFILITLLSLTAAWLYLRYTKPMYSVSSTLLIRNDNSSRGSGGTTSQDMFADIALFQSNTNKQNEILILISRTMMERVVKSLGLQTAYAVAGNVKTTNIYPEQPFRLEIISLADSTRPYSLEVHFNADWNSFQLGKNPKDWVIGQEIQTSVGRFKLLPRESFYRQSSFKDYIVNWMPLQDAAGSYIGGLDVKPANDLANVLRLSYINENPQLSAAVLNELMLQYNKAAIEDKNEINRKILAFITDRLTLVETQLDSVEGNLQRFRTSRQVIDLSAQSAIYFENMNQLNESLRQQEVQLQVTELLEQYLNQSSNRLSLVPSTLGLNDPTLLELTAGYNRLVTERLGELQTGATLNNPIIKNLEKNIEEARIKMLQNLANIKQVYRNTIAALNGQSGSLKKKLLQFRKEKD